jgi:putative aldouronate transport system substrate-binding protein
MSTKKLGLILVSCLVAFSMLFTACGGAKATTETTAAQETSTVESAQATTAEEIADPFGKMSEETEITACRILTSWMGFDEGENENNNWWSKMYLEKLGIKLNVVWTANNWGEPIEQKINTAIATDDLPDVVPIYSSYAYKIAKAGKAGDLKEAFDKYASPYVKKSLEIADGRALKASVYDGKMFAIPSTNMYNKSLKYAWIRADWLKKLNLEAPKTMEDLEKVAKAFKDNAEALGVKGIVPISAHKEFSGAGGSDIGEAVLEMMGGHLNGWYQKDGKLSFARIQPEVKEGLKKLAQWYKDGLLAKDFATKDPNNEESADTSAGKTGITFGSQNAPNGMPFRNLIKNNPEADWVYMPLSIADGSPVKQYAKTQAQDMTVITNKCKSPEAVVKLVNMASQVFSDEKPAFVTNNEYDSTKGGNMAFWNALVQFPSDVNANWNNWTVVRQDLKDGKDNTASYNMNQKIYYDQLKRWKDNGLKDKEGDLIWSLYKMNDFGGSNEWTNQNYDTAVSFDEMWGPETDSMVKYGGEWNTKFKEFFIKAIMTGNVDQEFDAWVNYWTTNGGSDTNKEVNDWFAANK